MDCIARLIYGSNMIESAGTSLDITKQLCAAVLQSDTVAAEISETDPKYEDHVKHLRANNRVSNRAEVVQSRREVIHHAQALKHVLGRKEELWSEALLLTLHHILHDGIDQWVKPGQYRTHEVVVRYEDGKAHLCMRANAVPMYMKEMIEQLNNDVAEGECAGWFDPFTLAAKYHYAFENMHPFGDGNGLMSRIVLNALLLRHAGCVGVIGVDEKEWEAYIDVVTRASKAFQAEDMNLDIKQHTGHLNLAKFLLRRSQHILIL
ncbi:Fic-domain-containing protein [Parathielavia hyrcaniae]|uniref:Fic-domain-containing protein n=1 Tax=Parathielavia hyrcaniae TaxID=113614 RepID=A0AAN6PWV5_9PEZI|nr:Fic-domain-containing protein [Parathielavia hyrcaniae]